MLNGFPIPGNPLEMCVEEGIPGADQVDQGMLEDFQGWFCSNSEQCGFGGVTVQGAAIPPGKRWFAPGI